MPRRVSEHLWYFATLGKQQNFATGKQQTFHISQVSHVQWGQYTLYTANDTQTGTKEFYYGQPARLHQTLTPVSHFQQKNNLTCTGFLGNVDSLLNLTDSETKKLVKTNLNTACREIVSCQDKITLALKRKQILPRNWDLVGIGSVLFLPWIVLLHYL